MNVDSNDDATMGTTPGGIMTFQFNALSVQDSICRS